MNTQKLLLRGHGRPDISLAHFSLNTLLAREQAATERAEALATRDFEPGKLHKAADWFGRNILWHDEFPQGLRLLVCDAPLYRLTALLSQDLPEMNDGQPLDYFDWGYVADVLRQLLADCKVVQEELALSRALAWAVWEAEKTDCFVREDVAPAPTAPAPVLPLLTSRLACKKAELDAYTNQPPTPGYDRTKHQLETEYWLLKNLVDEAAAL